MTSLRERMATGAFGGALIALGVALIAHAVKSREKRVLPSETPAEPPNRLESDDMDDAQLDDALEASFPASDSIGTWSG